ncbi:hypothetical protein HYPSUDRAFT_971293 [Hypholoma sublateritium FD-334 SS-4]|uniref:Uncharacterized protein n=1 Tax=Hypholoma sublateritium (strain FD-334 SS-4) TaxID=945553 RepID=A0A0D2PCS4_HYPSF|nr:hypothetical protein HYPSUDRAFT_971293 [Hypholoma sublateritium FD-334 SS-4]
MEGSRTGSPVPGHAPAHGYTQHHQGHGFGFGYHPPPPERAPVSPWSMNFRRASPPVSAQGSSSYFPAVPSPPPSSPALGGVSARPAYCYSTTTTSSLYMTATPAPTSPVSAGGVSPTIHAPTALAYSISSSSNSSTSSTSSAGRAPSGLSHLTHLLPARPKPQRVRPRFDFLPLLETPPSSVPSSALSSVAPSRAESPVPTSTTSDVDEGKSPCGETTPTDPDAEHEFPHALHDDCSMSSSEAETDGDGDGAPPTPSLTNASLDSSPRSRASSLEPREGDFAHLVRVPAQYGVHGQEKEKTRARSVERFARAPDGEPTERRRPASVSRERGADGRRYDVVPTRGCTSAGGSRQVSRERTQVSAATMFSAAYVPFRTHPPPPPPPAEAKPRAKKRNFIVVNDMEIELDDEDDEVADAAQEKGAQPPADTALSETRIPSGLSENGHDAAATPHASPVRA